MKTAQSYKIINADREYIFSTKYFKKLRLYMADVLGIDIHNKKTFKDIVHALEQASFYLITK